MFLKVRSAELTSETEEGRFSAQVDLQNGLNVVSAANTSGKSTLVQAIIYGLGLEKMLSPRREIPLPRVMTTQLRRKKDGPEIPVLASRVRLELENAAGRVITVARQVKGERDRRLVSVAEGAGLTTDKPVSDRRDFFAFDPGSAQAATGFQTFLTGFLGWEIPRVPRNNGGEAPLYLEAIFALAFVEQKAGWSVLPANFPTFLGLKDMPRRTVEFVLGLSVNEIEIERQRIGDRLDRIRNDWGFLAEEAARIGEMVEGRITDLPVRPDLNWESEGPFHLTLPMGKGWLDLESVLDQLRSELAAAMKQEIPIAAEEPGVEEALRDLLTDGSRLTAERHERSDDLNRERRQLRSTRRRLAAISEDLKRHQDVAKLISIGGEEVGPLGASSCPTCHQAVSESLLPGDAMGEAMSLEENQEFLKSQRDLFRSLEARGSQMVERKEKEYSQLGAAIIESQSRVRALKDTLSAASGTPSPAAIQRRVELKARIDALERVDTSLSEVLSKLSSLLDEYRSVKGAQGKLPRPGLSGEDQRRVNNLQELVISQLNEYDFSTFRAAEIEISPYSYRPVREKFEIGFELSASDAIRLKWAYQLALLEVTRGLTGAHHPGLLVFDEPRQQETDPVSFHSLIRRASQVADDVQIIFTTSEPKPTLFAAIEGLSLNLIDIDGYLLQPVG